MALSFTVEVFDVGDILFFFLANDVDICCRGVLALSMSLSTIVTRTSLVVLVLFPVGGRCLLLTGYVSREDIGRLILPRVLIPFFRWFIPLEIHGINLLGA